MKEIVKKKWLGKYDLETIVLGIILYGIILTYLYQFSQIVGKYEPWTTDEFFYYTEAKAISAYNNYQTPASLDGNTSYIGDFGFHGVSYALKDGILAKLFFQSQDPPLLWNNVLTCFAIIVIVLLFKPLSFKTRLKIAILISSHYVLYMSSFSYMQETIHYLLAVIALWYLHKFYAYNYTNANQQNKYIYYYLIIILIATTFRYGWFIWGLGLLPLATDLKSFIKWGFVAFGLLVFGVFISRYIAAPYPYDNMVADRIIREEKFALLNSIKIVWDEFTNNVQLYFSPAETHTTTIMRYLLFVLLITSTYYSIKKRNKFTIACTIISWGYFMAELAFYHVYWGYDERALAVLNPILAFSLIGSCNPYFFYPIMIIQLFVLPGVVSETKARNENAIAVNAKTPERLEREAAYNRIKDLITDEKRVVIATDVQMVVHGTANYFINFPLINSKGYPIHYRLHMYGTDLKGTNQPDYILNLHLDPAADKNQLIYSDKWIYLYKVPK
ncbi:MAG: hypothetical protein WBM13_02510 [Bacteroidia bacterium]